MEHMSSDGDLEEGVYRIRNDLGNQMALRTARTEVCFTLLLTKYDEYENKSSMSTTRYRMYTSHCFHCLWLGINSRVLAKLNRQARAWGAWLDPASKKCPRSFIPDRCGSKLSVPKILSATGNLVGDHDHLVIRSLGQVSRLPATAGTL